MSERQSAENDACEVHVPGRDRPSPWCASCRVHSVTPPAETEEEDWIYGGWK